MKFIDLLDYINSGGKIRCNGFRQTTYITSKNNDYVIVRDNENDRQQNRYILTKVDFQNTTWQKYFRIKPCRICGEYPKIEQGINGVYSTRCCSYTNKDISHYVEVCDKDKNICIGKWNFVNSQSQVITHGGLDFCHK